MLRAGGACTLPPPSFESKENDMTSRYGHQISGVQGFGGPVVEAFRRRLLDLETVYPYVRDKNLAREIGKEVIELQQRARYHVDLTEGEGQCKVSLYCKRGFFKEEPPFLVGSAPDLETVKLMESIHNGYFKAWLPVYSYVEQ